jgi:hypothetical protein
VQQALPIAAVLAIVSLGVTCSHAGRPCPTPRPFPARPPTRAPDDAGTTAAVAATGARYQICPAGIDYIIERPGARELTDAERNAVRAALYQSTPGRDMAGIGAVACPPAKPTLGVRLSIREGTATPAMIGERIAALADRVGGNPAIRVQVTIVSPPGPRCAVDDPACGPVPYKAACVERTSYDPKATRTLVRARPGRGPCAHDGDCRVGGCGNECVPASHFDHAGTCEEYGGWDNVYCGCLKNKCVWFTTD